MTCSDHHLGMQYVQVKPGKEPEVVPWCFTCKKRPTVLRAVVADAHSAKSEPPAPAAAKRTQRSSNGVRSS